MDENRPITAVETHWVYEKPITNGKMLLLTKGGMTVVGPWYGQLGEHFLAWAPMLKRDKIKEAELFGK